MYNPAMNMLSAAAALLALSTSVFAANQAGAAPRRIRFNIPQAHQGVFGGALERFSREVAEKTGGQIAVEVRQVELSDTKGGLHASDLAAQVQAGDVEMAQIYTNVLGSKSPELWALELPFAFSDYESAARFLDGPAAGRMLDGLTAQGLRGLAFTYSGGYKIIPTSGRELARMEDFKGLRLRSYVGPLGAAMMAAWGAQPVTRMGTSDLPDLMEAGSLDGGETTYPIFRRLEQFRGVKTVNETYHSLRTTAIVMNERFFASLTPEQRQIVRDAAVEAARAERMASIAEAEAARRFCVSRGIKIVTMTEAERRRMARAAQPVYDYAKTLMSPVWIAAVVDAGTRVPAAESSAKGAR